MWDRIKEIFCKFSPERDKKPPLSDTTSWINILCFYIFGTLAFFNQEMLYTASEDILSGRELPTATILVCFVTPLMLIKITAPWFIQRIPYAVKTCFIALCMALGLVLIVFVEDIRMKLLGIAINAIATGTAEVVFLGLTSFYPQVCISAFVAGTGMASLVSPLYYTGKKNNPSIQLSFNLIPGASKFGRPILLGEIKIDKRTTPQESSARQFSFEWSHFTISSTDWKVTATLYCIINSSVLNNFYLNGAHFS